MSAARLIQGDCLKHLGSIADGSIDLILADLPYGTTACRWDVSIPLPALWEHYRRLLKPRGAVVLTGSQPFTSTLVASNRDWFKYCLVWEKSSASGFLSARYRPLKAHEDIVVFSPAGSSPGSNPPMVFNPQKLVGKPYRVKRAPIPVGTSVSRSNVTRTPVSESSGDRFPRSVLRFANHSLRSHPTEKPVALMEYLTRTYSDPGGLVLDNTMGSGSTGVAAIAAGRQFVGIESDPAYFAIAEARIAAAVPPATRPGRPRARPALPIA